MTPTVYVLGDAGTNPEQAMRCIEALLAFGD